MDGGWLQLTMLVMVVITGIGWYDRQSRWMADTLHSVQLLIMVAGTIHTTYSCYTVGSGADGWLSRDGMTMGVLLLVLYIDRTGYCRYVYVCMCTGGMCISCGTSI